MGRWDRVRETAERLTGVALRPLAEVQSLQESEMELRGKQRELQDLAYTILDYAGGNVQDLKAQERRNLAQRARVVHQQDPQYGGTVNLLNEFVLGRGISRPQAVDDDVQSIVVDPFWEDPDNQRVLTTHSAQVRFNTDLSLQSNVFPLVYDDGEDAMVKLGLLDHDTVEEAVRDDDARLRILYYFTRSRSRSWDPSKHAYTVSMDRSKIRYYEEFRNLADAKKDQEAGVRKEDLPDIPEALVARGRVLHVAINRTMEQAFGVPEIARTIRWLTAYNDLMRARVDMAKAAASIIGRRKLKGGAAALQALASQTLLGASSVPNTPIDPMALGQAPRPASILEENDWVEHEAFNFNSGSAGAMQDAQMIRSQYSVGSGWPQSYLGDPSTTDLATATSLELRVLKMVETRQQVLEDVIRTLIDHAIRKAIEKGKLTRFRPMTADELKQEEHEKAEAAAVPGTRVAAAALRLVGSGTEDDETPPKGMVERDLTFSVAMPSPLRRAMGDLITAISTIAKTFDPNNSNMELSKTLLGIALGEALELEDPAAAVDRIFPPGYVDPMVAAAQAAQGAPGLPSMPPGSFDPADTPGFGAPLGADGNRHGNPDNPYGAKQQSQPPELTMQQAAYEDALADRKLVILHARGGDPMSEQVQEGVIRRAMARQSPTANGRSAATIIGAQRASASDMAADSVLGPAVARALAMVAEG